jgi:SAM-dependent methyltransferase
VISPFYDLDLEGYADDVALYRALAEERGGAVLELGCGTGRVALALAVDDHEVVGVDNSPAMLDRARTKDAAHRVRWIEGDIRALDLARRFALVLAPLGVLQHLTTVDDVVATFQVIARHMEPDGIAVIDVEAPRAEDFEAGPQPLLEHWTRTWQGGQVTKLVSVEGMPSLGLREVTWHFDQQLAEGPLRRHTARFALRSYTPAELELAGRLVGLTVVAVHGDYDGTPYDDAAQRLLMTFVAGSPR